MSDPIRIPLPKLGHLYQKAVLSAARSKLSPGGSLKALPERPVLAEHPGLTEEEAEQYRLLFAGESFDGSHRRSLPSVMLHIAGFPVQMALMSRDDFPLPLMGMVHLANEVTHHQPVHAGSPLQILARAENFAPHRRGTQVDIVVEVYPKGPDVTAAGPQDPLYTSTSRYLGLGTYLYSKTEAATDVRQEFTPPPKTGLWTLGADAGRQYAAVSGDFNPIHLSTLTGKALGQKGAIVHGMYLAARMLEGREPETAGHSWRISFEAPVKLPGKVAFAAQPGSDTSQEFVGWNPRTGRRHFTGELTLP
jgi:acyl dehydratase